MGEAIDTTQDLYPGLLECNTNLLFMLKCRQFIEMVNGTDSEVRGPAIRSPRSFHGGGGSNRSSPSMSPVHCGGGGGGGTSHTSSSSSSQRTTTPSSGGGGSSTGSGSPSPNRSIVGVKGHSSTSQIQQQAAAGGNLNASNLNQQQQQQQQQSHSNQTTLSTSTTAAAAATTVSDADCLSQQQAPSVEDLNAANVAMNGTAMSSRLIDDDDDDVEMLDGLVPEEGGAPGVGGPGVVTNGCTPVDPAGTHLNGNIHHAHAGDTEEMGTWGLVELGCN
jgi:hypothetical protein